MYKHWKQDYLVVLEIFWMFSFFGCFQLVFVFQIQAYPVLGITTLSNTRRYWSFNVFPIEENNTIFTLCWRKAGMSIPVVQGENKQLQASLQFKVIRYLATRKYHPRQGIPFISNKRSS